MNIADNASIFCSLETDANFSDLSLVSFTYSIALFILFNNVLYLSYTNNGSSFFRMMIDFNLCNHSCFIGGGGYFLSNHNFNFGTSNASSAV